MYESLKNKVVFITSASSGIDYSTWTISSLEGKIGYITKNFKNNTIIVKAKKIFKNKVSELLEFLR